MFITIFSMSHDTSSVMSNHDKTVLSANVIDTKIYYSAKLIGTLCVPYLSSVFMHFTSTLSPFANVVANR